MNNRIETNLAILKLTQQIDSLKEYTGYGGLHKSMRAEDYNNLKQVLSEQEFNNITASCKTAYYTPAEIIRFMYTALQNMGFTGGRVLDPACGHGAFIFNMPDAMRLKSVIHAVELEGISAKLAKTICPYAKVLNRGFESVAYPKNSFDLIIGNPPYAKDKVTDPQYPEYSNLALHHYFVAKSIELLKEGGILAMVLPQYCLDNLSEHPREIMNKHGSLVAAYRLPDCLFGGAKITVDVVFYVKSKINDTRFTELQAVTVNNQSLKLNEYYLQHPEHIIGKLNTCNMFGERIGLTVSAEGTPASIFEKLNHLAAQLPVICKPKAEVSMASEVFGKVDQKIAELRRDIDQVATVLEGDLLKLELEKYQKMKALLITELNSKDQLIKMIINRLKL